MVTGGGSLIPQKDIALLWCQKNALFLYIFLIKTESFAIISPSKIACPGECYDTNVGSAIVQCDGDSGWWDGISVIPTCIEQGLRDFETLSQ